MSNKTYDVDALFGIRLLASHLPGANKDEARVRVEAAFRYAVQLLNGVKFEKHPTIAAFDWVEGPSAYTNGIQIIPNECEGCDCTCHEED